MAVENGASFFGVKQRTVKVIVVRAMTRTAVRPNTKNQPKEQLHSKPVKKPIRKMATIQMRRLFVKGAKHENSINIECYC
jgi:hypothetical protein